MIPTLPPVRISWSGHVSWSSVPCFDLSTILVQGTNGGHDAQLTHRGFSRFPRAESSAVERKSAGWSRITTLDDNGVLGVRRGLGGVARQGDLGVVMGRLNFAFSFPLIATGHGS